MSSAAPIISPALFAFLRDLRENNDRAWFAENKARYVEEVRNPMLAFIGAFSEPLAKVSPHFVADTRANGGSLFRIYRDTRFGHDKTPYKTNVGAHFRHAAGKDAHAPGFYLHLEPDTCFAGCGVWHPDAPVLGKIRDAIVAKPDAWRRAVSSKPFRETFHLAGDSLKRPPKGYDGDHPLIADLKRKDFVAITEFTEEDALAGDFMKRFAAICRAGAPLAKFLTGAVGVPF